MYTTVNNIAVTGTTINNDNLINNRTVPDLRYKNITRLMVSVAVNGVNKSN